MPWWNYSYLLKINYFRVDDGISGFHSEPLEVDMVAVSAGRPGMTSHLTGKEQIEVGMRL
jgi:hypothetical protein